MSAFIGTWRLLSFEAHTSDGQRLHPYGHRPIGQLVYDALGSMAVQIMDHRRRGFGEDDKYRGSSEEIRDAFVGYEAYFGTYVVDEEHGTVTHRVEAALFPNWVGSEQRRYFHFSEDRLTLSTSPMPYGGATVSATLVWERAGQRPSG